MALKAATVRLSNGIKMPQFGLGTWLSERGQVQLAVEKAIDLGYRQFDCAWVYDNEDEVGTAIRNKIREGVVKREDLFIVSKLWNIFHKRDDVQRAFDMSLRNLDCDYLDLYLMHFPLAYQNINDEPFPIDPKLKRAIYDDIDYLETYNEMEKLVGKSCYGLGLSNFNQYQTSRILQNSSEKPLVNQIESNPYLHQQDLVNHCRSNGIEIMAYSPLGNPAAPPTRRWNEDAVPLIKDAIITRIAEKYNKTNAQVLIRYALDRNLVVIPKSITPERLQSNADVFDFKLSPEDLSDIQSLERGFRVVEISGNREHKYYPWTENYSE